MKHLFLIFFIVLCNITFSQIDLPTYIEDDTVYIKNGWVESPKSEAKQRKKILVLEKKLSKIKHLNHQRQGIEQEIDSLLNYVEKLELERDSLLAHYDEKLEREKENTYYQVKILEDEIKKAKAIILKQNKAIRRNRIIKACLIGVVVAESVVILVLI